LCTFEKFLSFFAQNAQVVGNQYIVQIVGNHINKFMKYQIALLCVLVLFSGCNTFKKTAPQDLKVVQLPTMNLDEKSSILENSAKTISNKTDDVEIKTETVKIDNVAQDLKQDHEKYETLLAKIFDLEKEVNRRDIIIEQYEQESAQVWINIIEYGLYIGGALTVAGILATIFGSRIPMLGGIGFSILASGIVTVAVCYSLMTHAKYIAIIGIVMVIGVIIWAIVRALKDRDNVEVSETVQIELVKTIEYLKKHGWDSEHVRKIQSPETEAKISWIKNNLMNNDRTKTIKKKSALISYMGK
jgi:hypothetical protein